MSVEVVHARPKVEKIVATCSQVDTNAQRVDRGEERSEHVPEFPSKLVVTGHERARHQWHPRSDAQVIVTFITRAADENGNQTIGDDLGMRPDEFREFCEAGLDLCEQLGAYSYNRPRVQR